MEQPTSLFTKELDDVTPGTHEQVMILSTTEPLAEGPVASLSDIQHLTLFPWITLRKDQWPQFDAVMQTMLTTDMPRNLVGGERVNFGTDVKPLWVRKLIGLDADLRVGIASNALALGGRYDPTYTEFNTESHVSDTPLRQFGEGEVFQLASMVAIARDLEQQQKVVRAIYRWARPSRWYL